MTATQIADRIAREEDERRQRRDRERRERWETLIRDRGSRYDECRLQNFRCDSDAQASAVKALFDYCSNITERVADGRGIVLFGPRGTGKDHLAMAVCRAAVRSDLTVLWQNGMDLFGDIRDAMDDERGLSERQFVERLVRPDLLYLSDPLPPMGALTPFQAAMMFRILDARYSRNKPVICTVNVSGGSELDERLGPQNADRLRHGSLAVFCCWPSARKAQ